MIWKNINTSWKHILIIQPIIMKIKKKKNIYSVLFEVKLYCDGAKLNRKSETSKRFRIFLLYLNVF